jgi:ketosteroid isomerase-like protein
MSGPQDMIERLVRAVNAHDLDTLVACFSDDYENETPAHPARSFRGSEQVRHNWGQIFAFVPDLQAKLTRTAIDGETVWSEWEMSGTRRDGSLHEMRGVIIFGIRDGLAVRARFYLEPVDSDTTTVDEAVREQVVRD